MHDLRIPHEEGLIEEPGGTHPGALPPTAIPAFDEPTVRRPVLTPLLAGWIVGTALQLNQDTLSSPRIYAAILAVSVALWLFLAIKSVAMSRQFWRRASLAFLAGACLAFALCGLRAEAFARNTLPASLEGRDVQVQGQIAAMPQRNAGGVRFRFEVESASVVADAGPAAVTLPPLIYLGWYGEPGGGAVPDLKPGQRWQAVVRLKAPHGNSNPHGFDYELWLWEQGLQATGYVRAGPGAMAPRLIGQTAAHPVEQARQAVREAIYAAVPERRTAGVIAALVVGDQAAIERADWDVFRATGVAHLMSISGLHVTLFAWLAAALVRRLWRRSAVLCLWVPAPHAALVGGVLLAAGYALFSGWGVPAQRTVIMLAVVALLRWLGRRWPWSVVWLTAVAVVLAWDPWALLQAGFWLSFVAVAVLFASDAGKARVLGHGSSGDDGDAHADTTDDGDRHARLRRRWLLLVRWQPWLAPVQGLLREQAVVTLALTPLSLLLFGQFSVVGLIANLLAIPWVTLVVTPLAMLGVLWGPVWQVCTWALDLLSWLLQAMAVWPFATYSVAAPPLWAGVAGILGGVLLVLRLPWGLRALGLPLLLPVLLWQAPRPAPGQFEVLAADVGQGTAVLVRTAGHSLLYDAGPRFGPESDAGHRVLVPLLRALNEKLDLLLLSHRDADHTGGAVSVLAMQPQARVLSSIEAGHGLQALRPVQRCLAGQRWQWDGVDFEVLHPQTHHYGLSADAVPGRPLKSNALSCVLRVSTGDAATAGSRAVLLTGDIEQAQEAELLAGPDAAKLKADVLLVPHHGSKTSSSAAFLAAVEPRWALVQSGYRNRFGHPAAPVVARYAEQGLTPLDSPHCGAATWFSAQADVVLCQRTLQRRYWHHRAP